MISILNKKYIAIETMPSSNIRISFYEKYSDHHIFKWMDMANPPHLVICSDDPGIFATNLRNEFLHILNHSNKVDKIKEIMENGERFKFGY